MKSSKVEIKKSFAIFFLWFAIGFGIFTFANAQQADNSLRPPNQPHQEIKENAPTQLDLKSLPNFPTTLQKKDTPRRISTSALTIPLDTRLRLIVDSNINSKTSKPGDYFKAHLLDDFYIPSDPPQLIIPKGSWVRGRISFIKKPIIFTMTGKIGLHLDILTTPVGEFIPLDAELNVEQGIVNDQGLLDPIINNKTKAQELGFPGSIPGGVITLETLGTPVIEALVNGSLIALFSQGDNVSLYKGQELQIVLKKDIQLTRN